MRKAAADQAEADRLAEEERQRREAQLTEDLATAVSDAMAANTAAAKAAADAAAAVGTLAGTTGVTVQQGIDAEGARSRAVAAAATAAAEHAKAIAAQSARDLAAAQAAAMAAAEAQRMAEAALGEITDVQAQLDEANRLAMEKEERDRLEAEALAQAKSDASDAAMAAATAVASIDDDAGAGVALNDSATIQLIADAKAAAAEAQAASNSAQMAENSADARMYANTAMEKQTEAENKAMAAVVASNEAVRISGIGNPDEVRAILEARSAANAAYQAAMRSARAARAAADAAPDSADAQTAAQASEDAAAAAKIAANNANAATTLADAEAAKMLAESEAGKAEDQRAAAVLASASSLAYAQILQDAKTNAAININAAKSAASDAQSAIATSRSTSMDAVSDATAARTNRADAEAADMKVAEASTMADNAATAASEAETAVNDATTTAEVTAAVAKADEAKANAMKAEEDAAKYAMMATEAAQEHILALFKAANAVGVEAADGATDDTTTPNVDESSDEYAMSQRLMAMVTALNTAAAVDTAGTAPTAATVTLEYNPDGRGDRSADDSNPAGDEMKDDDGNDIASKLEVSVVIGGINIANADFTGVGDADPVATNTPIYSPESRWNGWKAMELTEGTAHVHLYTDVRQDDLEVDTITKTIVEADERVNDDGDPIPNPDSAKADPPNAQIDATVSLTLAHGQPFKGKFDHDNDAETDALVGEFLCRAETCTFVTDGDGKITSATGYDFFADALTTTTTAYEQIEHDYLAFGVWLNADATTPVFNAFATGNDPFTAGNLVEALVGTATYRGPATGVHTSGDSVDFFQGDATLTANFGAIDTDAERGTDPPADTAMGTIEGAITNIRVGAGPATGRIDLRQTAMTTGTNSVTGRATMGPAVILDPSATNPQVDFTYSGRWDATFYGNGAEASDLPEAIAGTFGVSGTDDMGTTDTDDDVTMSFIGAFGAKR